MEIKICNRANKADGRFYASALQLPNWLWGALKRSSVERGVSEHHILKDALKKELHIYNHKGGDND